MRTSGKLVVEIFCATASEIEQKKHDENKGSRLVNILLLSLLGTQQRERRSEEARAAAMRASSRAVPPEGGGGGATTHSSSSSSPSSSPSSLVLRRLVPLLLLFVAAAVLPAPTRPSVMTDFFASRELGRRVQCGYSSSGKAKENNNDDSSDGVAAACSRAHSSAAAAASLSDFLGNSLALLVAPALGRASDGDSSFVVAVVAGPQRKTRRSVRAKFLSLSLLASTLPPLTLALHQSPPSLPPPLLHLLSPASSSSSAPPPSPLLYLYFLFSALATAAPGAAICLAYAADALPAGGRAPAFAAVSAAVSGGLLLGAGAGAFLAAKTAAWLATGGVVLSAVLAAWLPEVQQQGRAETTLTTIATTARTTAARAAKSRSSSSSSSFSSSNNNPLSAFKLLTSTPQLARLLACVVLSGAAAQGLSDTIAQFLQQRLSFGASDQALLLAVAGGGGVVCQALVLPRLLSSGIVAGEPGLLRVGLAAALLEHLALLLFAKSKLAALSAVGVGALGGLSFPAASALASDGAGDRSGVQGGGGQGAVQGALSAARSGAAAVGPLAVGGIYWFASRRLPESCAGAPFLFGAALLLAALVLSLKVVAAPPAAGGRNAAAVVAVAAERAPADEEKQEQEQEAADDEEEAAPLISSAATRGEE